MGMKKWLSCVLLGTSVLGAIYCLLGVTLSAWLSATPGYSLEAAQKACRLWILGVVSFSSLFVYTLWRLNRGRRNSPKRDNGAGLEKGKSTVQTNDNA